MRELLSPSLCSNVAWIEHLVQLCEQGEHRDAMDREHHQHRQRRADRHRLSALLFKVLRSDHGRLRNSGGCRYRHHRCNEQTATAACLDNRRDPTHGRRAHGGCSRHCARRCEGRGGDRNASGGQVGDRRGG